MKHYFSDHARERATERYGRKFSADELNAIFDACVGGRALLGRLCDDGTTCYRMVLADGLVVCPVMARQKSFIVTFMPSDFFSAGHRRRAGREAGLIKQVFSAAKHAKTPYRRERISLANLRQAEDFG